MVLVMASGRFPHDEASQICVVLALVFHILATEFGNLETVENWSDLHERLSGKKLAKGTSATVMDTIELFQSKTSVRVAFLDGQARMVATLLYLHQRIPCANLVPTGISNPTHDAGGRIDIGAELAIGKSDYFASSRISEPMDLALRSRWSLKTTGKKATCRLFVPSRSGDGQRPSVPWSAEVIDDLNMISLNLCQNLDLGDSIHLSDAISWMIRRAEHSEVVCFPSKVEEYRASLSSCFMQFVVASFVRYPKIANVLFADFVTSKPRELFDKVVSAMAQAPSAQSSRTPVIAPITTSLNPDVAEGHVLSIFIAPLLLEKSSRDLLASCLNKNWLVPLISIVASLEHHMWGPVPRDASEYNDGTFVRPSDAEQKTRFHLFLYKVKTSKMVSIPFFVICSETKNIARFWLILAACTV